MLYVDAFVVPVKTAREADYRKMAEMGCKMWMDHGALSYMECRADDVPDVKLTSYPTAVKLEPDEMVYVSFITYRDRAHRDEVNAKVMADPRANEWPMEGGPANMQRLIFGGFTQVVTSS